MRKSLQILISVSILAVLAQARINGTCKTLILSGGANKGSYEAGALYEWAHGSADIIGGTNEIEYEVLSGISAGSMNSIGLSLFKLGEVQKQTEFVYNLWQHTQTDYIYKFWDDDKFYGLVKGMFEERGLVNDAPLINFLSTIFDSANATGNI